MSNIYISGRLPFTSVKLTHQGQSLVLDRVLVDTGSSATVFNTDRVMEIGVMLQPNDPIRFMLGIGGREAVIEKTVDKIQVGKLNQSNFAIQVGAVSYGRTMDGILGLDFLLAVDATLDFKSLEIY